jgi:hypothetical protein
MKWTRTDTKCVVTLFCFPAVVVAAAVLCGILGVFVDGLIGPCIHYGCELGRGALEWLGL